jgi:hypothetical protein
MNKKIFSAKKEQDTSKVLLEPKAKCASKKCTYCSQSAVYEAVYLSAFICTCEDSACIENAKKKALLTGK